MTRALLGSLAGVAIAVGVVVVGPGALPPRVLVALAAVATGGAVGHHWLVRTRQAWVGVRAERLVAKTLNRFKGATAVGHGILLGRGDADHIVAGPGLLVIETKAGTGQVGVDRSGRVVAGRRTLRGDPVRQARRAAEHLSRQLGVPAQAVVCVAEGDGIERVGDVVLCGRKQLREVWRNTPHVVTDGPGLLLALPTAADDE